MSFHSYSTAENQRLKRTERPDRFHSPRRTVAVEVGSQVYGTHHTARQYAHSQVFTESYKKYLGRSRPAARSWNFYCCECAVSLARSRSTPRFSASFSRPRSSSASTRDYSPSPSPSPALCSSFLLRALFLSRSVHETDLYLFLFGRQGNDKATHLLIVADPQILDERSYPQRSSLLRTVSRIFVDMNLRKAWRVAKSTHPHAVIFLGDLMDNGFADMHIAQYVCPSSPPAPPFFFLSYSRIQVPTPPFSLSLTLGHRYQEYAARFHSIFSAPPSLPVYYMPGNHDVGLENGSNTSPVARARYRTTFGPLSQHVVLGGHSLFLVDAPGLVEEDWRRESAGSGRGNGLPMDLAYLRHMRTEHAASEHFKTFDLLPRFS